jgi:predicted N-formylglutamate amidohydrolase
MAAESGIEAARLLNAEGASDVVIVCEHAAWHVPDRFGDLGLAPDARRSHAAWDPGALALAQRLSARLDACLVAGGVSRLVIDCNRPPEAPDAMPARVERIDVPGNRDLSEAARAARISLVHRPFARAVAAAMAARPNPVLVTIHSFTPIFAGRRREVEIGVLHDADARLADGMLADPPPGPRISRNRPYGPADGVTHTLRTHALPGGHPNVMLEVRSDLIAEAAAQDGMAALLAPWLLRAVAALQGERAGPIGGRGR